MTRKGILFSVLLIVAGLFLIQYFGNAPRFYIKDINKGYKGVIRDKYFNKVTHLKIMTNGNEDLDIAMLSGELDRESVVGDTIEKLSGDNYVFLYNKGKRVKLLYLYIPPYVRDDGRWPAQWKNKWNDQQ